MTGRPRPRYGVQLDDGRYVVCWSAPPKGKRPFGVRRRLCYACADGWYAILSRDPPSSWTQSSSREESQRWADKIPGATVVALAEVLE